MSKILDNDYRTSLFKSMKEGGFTKEEALKIISTKYKGELTEMIVSKYNAFIALLDNITKDNVEEIKNSLITPATNQFENDSAILDELAKLSEF